MQKIAFASLLLLLACNSSAEKEKEQQPAGKETVKAAHAWPHEEENEFLASCVENAKTRINEAAAFAHCNCVLGKLKQDFPNIDSASKVLLDTTRAAVYVNDCK